MPGSTHAPAAKFRAPAGTQAAAGSQAQDEAPDSLTFIEVLATSIALIGPSMTPHLDRAVHVRARRQRHVAGLRLRRHDADLRRALHQPVRAPFERRRFDVWLRRRSSGAGGRRDRRLDAALGLRLRRDGGARSDGALRRAAAVGRGAARAAARSSSSCSRRSRGRPRIAACRSRRS